MAPITQIVVTGMGLVTPLGASTQETWRSVLEGRVGIATMPALEQQPSPDKGGGQAVEPHGRVSPDLPRAARYLRCAVSEALEQAGLLPNGEKEAEHPRIAAALGTTLHGMRAAGKFLRSGEYRHLRKFLAGSVLDDALSNLGVGPIRLTTCSACSSGLGSVALGVTLLRDGVADAVIVGGYDAVSEYVYAGFDSLRLIANGPPRPFDAQRDGMKVAEGYGALVLETLAHATARGAAPLAVVAGIGESSDSFHLTQPQPDGEGAARAIASALADANVGPESLHMVAAHATSTPNNDAAEYRAFLRVFGDRLQHVPVVAFKGQLGHSLGAAGAVELVLSILSLKDGVVPQTRGTAQVDPAFQALNLIRETPLHRSIDSAANVSLGFGGANTCVVVTRPQQVRPVRQPPTVESEVLITGAGVVLPGVVSTGIPEEFRRARGDSFRPAGSIPDSEFEHLLTARRSRRMSGYAKVSVAAAAAACADAGLVAGSTSLSECNAILGTAHGSSPFCEEYYKEIVTKGIGSANPALFAEGVPNAAAAHLSMALGVRGGCQTIIGTWCAGMTALILASMRIRAGLWSRAIVVAGEEFSEVVNLAHEHCGNVPALDATGGCSGAVAIVLESKRAAEDRGARSIARVHSWAWSNSIAGIVAGIGRPDRVWSSSDLTDLSDASTLGQDHVSLVSTRDRVPDCFSVGPLAALLCGISEHHENLGVIAREPGGGLCGVRITATSDPLVSRPA